MTKKESRICKTGLHVVENATVHISDYLTALIHSAPPELTMLRDLYLDAVNDISVNEHTIETLKAKHGIKGHNTPLAFRRYTGVSLKQFMVHHRVRLAEILLTETDCTIADIGIMIGFREEHSFTMLFKKKTGLCPQAFRQKMQTQSM